MVVVSEEIRRLRKEARFFIGRRLEMELIAAAGEAPESGQG